MEIERWKGVAPRFTVTAGYIVMPDDSELESVGICCNDCDEVILTRSDPANLLDLFDASVTHMAEAHGEEF